MIRVLSQDGVLADSLDNVVTKKVNVGDIEFFDPMKGRLLTPENEAEILQDFSGQIERKEYNLAEREDYSDEMDSFVESLLPVRKITLPTFDSLERETKK